MVRSLGGVVWDLGVFGWGVFFLFLGILYYSSGFCFCILFLFVVRFLFLVVGVGVGV